MGFFESLKQPLKVDFLASDEFYCFFENCFEIKFCLMREIRVKKALELENSIKPKKFNK